MSSLIVHIFITIATTIVIFTAVDTFAYFCFYYH